MRLLTRGAPARRGRARATIGSSRCWSRNRSRSRRQRSRSPPPTSGREPAARAPSSSDRPAGVGHRRAQVHRGRPQVALRVGGLARRPRRASGRSSRRAPRIRPAARASRSPSSRRGRERGQRRVGGPVGDARPAGGGADRVAREPGLADQLARARRAPRAPARRRTRPGGSRTSAAPTRGTTRGRSSTPVGQVDIAPAAARPARSRTVTRARSTPPAPEQNTFTPSPGGRRPGRRGAPARPRRAAGSAPHTPSRRSPGGDGGQLLAAQRLGRQQPRRRSTPLRWPSRMRADRPVGARDAGAPASHSSRGGGRGPSSGTRGREDAGALQQRASRSSGKRGRAAVAARPAPARDRRSRHRRRGDRSRRHGGAQRHARRHRRAERRRGAAPSRGSRARRAPGPRPSCISTIPPGPSSGASARASPRRVAPPVVRVGGPSRERQAAGGGHGRRSTGAVSPHGVRHRRGAHAEARQGRQRAVGVALDARRGVRSLWRTCVPAVEPDLVPVGGDRPRPGRGGASRPRREDEERRRAPRAAAARRSTAGVQRGSGPSSKLSSTRGGGASTAVMPGLRSRRPVALALDRLGERRVDGRRRPPPASSSRP